MCSYASPSEEVPAPRAIARSMLSFGIELSRAFWIAVARVGLASGSAPPSFAATMIARESLEKSCPRFASAAPFLCLMLDHLLCPDTAHLLDQGREQLVDPKVVGELGVERREEETSVAHQDGLRVERAEHFDRVTEGADARGADEDAPQRDLVPCELHVRLEAPHLAPERVSVDHQ